MARDTKLHPKTTTAGTMSTRGGSTLLLVTGASRGLGRSISSAFAERAAELTGGGLPLLRVALVARSEDGLAETERELTRRRRAKDESDGSSSTLEVSRHVADLSDLDGLDATLDELFRCIEPAEAGAAYSRAILINNAGSLGPLGRCSDPSGRSSLAELRSAVDFNVTSSVWISTRFVRRFSAKVGCGRVTVVNISSLCAVQPFPTMATYCAGKSARDMFHAVLAKEEEGGDSSSSGDAGEESKCVRVLNYAPGPLETDMTRHLAECEALDGNLRGFYRESLEKGTLVGLDDSARRLVGLVVKDEFENGSHVDYYDLDGKQEGEGEEA